MSVYVHTGKFRIEILRRTVKKLGKSVKENKSREQNCKTNAAQRNSVLLIFRIAFAFKINRHILPCKDNL